VVEEARASRQSSSGADRSEWDPETLLERRYDMARAVKAFEDASAR
jgi:hypothetical protein